MNFENLRNERYLAFATGIFLWVLFSYSLVCLDTGSHYFAQDGLELLRSSNPPASASGVAATIGRHHQAQLAAGSF